MQDTTANDLRTRQRAALADLMEAEDNELDALDATGPSVTTYDDGCSIIVFGSCPRCGNVVLNTSELLAGGTRCENCIDILPEYNGPCVVCLDPDCGGFCF